MPVVHVVTFTFNPAVADDVIADLTPALDDLAAQSKALWYQHGPDLGVREGNADYAVTAVFPDEEAFRAYMTAPQHQRVINELVRPHLQARSAVQFTSPCPGVGPPPP